MFFCILTQIFLRQFNVIVIKCEQVQSIVKYRDERLEDESVQRNNISNFCNVQFSHSFLISEIGDAS